MLLGKTGLNLGFTYGRRTSQGPAVDTYCMSTSMSWWDRWARWDGNGGARESNMAKRQGLGEGTTSVVLTFQPPHASTCSRSMQNKSGGAYCIVQYYWSNIRSSEPARAVPE